MRKFSIGERARIKRNAWAGSIEAALHLGEECTIVGFSSALCPCRCGTPCYYIKFDSATRTFECDERVLRKKKRLPDADTYQKVSWDLYHSTINPKEHNTQ